MSFFADGIARIGSENAFKVGPKIAKVEASGRDVVRLNVGEPDFPIPSCVKEEIKRQLDKDNTHYCDPRGILSLRKAIANHVQKSLGLSYSPEQVVVTPAGKTPIAFTQQMLCNPGDEVVYPTPGYPIYESFATYLGCVPKPLVMKEENDFSCTAAELEPLLSHKTKVIVLNFPSNPTGGVATEEQLKAIAQVIIKKCSPHVRVFSDEIYQDIVFDGRKHISIASMPGMQERTIISNGFSKSFAWTGGRVGYMLVPTMEEAEVLRNLNINYFTCVPPFTQEGAREALENPASWEHVAMMRKVFEERRDFTWKKLSSMEGVRCRKPGGAFYLFPNIDGICEKLGIIEAFNKLPENVRGGTSPATLFQLFALFGHQVAVLDRRSFGTINSDGQHFIRLSTASSIPDLERGLQRLANASQDKAGFERFMKEEGYLW